MSRINIPDTRFDPESRLGTLDEKFSYFTGIKGYTAACPKVLLCHDGYLMIEPGYVFDYGSGPAIDTPEMIYASLVHDALYDLMTADRLPWKKRKQVDKLFYKMLLEAGCPPFRAWYCYWGVRLGYPVYKALAGDN